MVISKYGIGGRGISDEVREKIFAPFFTTKSSGTGLGLPIVKRLVEAQGGTVGLGPRDGGGTVAESPYRCNDHEHECGQDVRSGKESRCRYGN